ncbi:flagellar biosynthetic protein FliQ [Limimonas halophila]|uniref:Flagellar biosynthetic protein FliQ n=1 Tax=Limimonas halophila TaxID=1082479 RepID=A0A1G7Q7E1_9PROT|nr:flagellar biosynthesis protein FliQ [Limimonas halophila]SDF94452.1 flagellar biosynthetic protein FliQ [Limimonas halophila]
MNETEIIAIGRDAVYVMLMVAGPIMLIALFVGLAVALIQALTQIQEMTLAFVPKIIAIMIAIMALAPYMVNQLQSFADQVNERIVTIES